MPEDLNEGVEPGAAASVAARLPLGRPALGRGMVAGVAVVALLVGGAGLGVALSRPGGTTTHVATCSSTTPKLKVQGTGQATGTPDVLTLVLQVNASAGSATAALSQDNTKVGAAVLALLAGGVAKRDIQTTGLTLQTQYAYPKGVPTITGYQVTNTVTAAMHDTGKAGTAIDDVVNAAGNAAQINSLTFSFDNPAKVEDKARASAVHQAVSHARAMAQAAGRPLGRLCSLTDNTQPQVVVPEFDQAEGATAAAAGSVPLESGSQTETDQVTLVYALG